MPDEETPKIIVDDDWKSQAKAEKEKLASEAAESAEHGTPGGAGEGRVPQEPTFDDMIRMLATQALMYLGAFPDPQTGKATVALDIAKLNIDLLGVLEEKTKGNLTEDEAATLSSTLSELRTQFVEIARVVEKAASEGRISESGEIASGQQPGQQPGGGAGGIQGGGLV